MKNIIKSTLVLVAITLIAGLALATVYEVTKTPIAAAEKKAQDDAYRMVLPNVQDFIENSEAYERVTYPYVGENDVSINGCLWGVSSEPETDPATGIEQRLTGYVVNVTTPNGYGGEINLAVGISYDGVTITGVSVISQSETPGLGAVCTDRKFTDQFKGIAGFVEYVKTGKTEPNQIDAISGATITTKAVTEAVNAAKTHVAEYERNTAEEGMD